MKKLILLLLFISLVFSCSKEKENLPLSYPSLTITNQSSIMSIHTVSLVGYSFENLSIGLNESKTFALTTGVTGGLSNVSVQLGWLCGGKNNWTARKSLNFKNGENTTATLDDDGQGGCLGVLE
tara:strand:+ start:104 stop:475 length:372 start_codon:yes stop_codon:yes gene_type:complete